MNLYDLIIIGAGPAGITASIYAARKQLDFLVITKDIGGQTILSSNIENYTGYQFISGAELIKRFKEHLGKFNIKKRENEAVTLVGKEENIIAVKTEKEIYRAKTVIVATGRKPKKLGVDGEEKYRNHGVSYCATCDGPLFMDMDVAVVGGGNSALDAVLQLIKIARKIYLIDISPHLQADPVLIEKAKGSEKVSFYNGSAVKEIYGTNFVQGIKIATGKDVVDLPVEGIFIEIGSIPSADFVRDVLRNEEGEIIVNCQCQTNIPGIFAAGDVTNVLAKQIIVACGEGTKALIGVFEYLTKNG